MSTCRGCGADVIFVPSVKSGKPMILDAAPKKGVVLTIQSAGQPRDLLANTLDAPKALVVDVYTDHHATCPKAEEFRRPPEGGGRKD